VSLVVEQRLVPQVLPVHPGVPFPHELPVDVPVAHPHVPDSAAVAVGIDDPHLDLLAEHLV